MVSHSTAFGHLSHKITQFTTCWSCVSMNMILTIVWQFICYVPTVVIAPLQFQPFQTILSSLNTVSPFLLWDDNLHCTWKGCCVLLAHCYEVRLKQILIWGVFENHLNNVKTDVTARKGPCWVIFQRLLWCRKCGIATSKDKAFCLPVASKFRNGMTS